MAYYQQTTPPPNKSFNFTLNNFSGGINNTSELLEKHQATDILNMSFSDDAILDKRKGTTPFDATDLSLGIEFLDVYKPYTDADQNVYATVNGFYINNVKVATTTQVGLGVNYNGKYLFADGDKLYVYGTFPQATTTYERVTGTPTLDYVVMEVRTPDANFIPLDTTHSEGVTVYDYTAKWVMYEPCQLEIEDTYKGSNVVPNDVQFVINHKGRIFASGSKEDNDNVFITDMANPYYFPVYLPIQVPPNSDKIRGLVVYDDAVLVGREHDIHVIHGITNRTDMGDTFFLRKMNTHTGFANHQAISVAHNFLFFVGYDGNCYAISSVNQAQNILSTSRLNTLLDFRKEPFTEDINGIRNATAFFHDDLWYVSIGTKVGVYSYRVRAWTVYDGWNARSFAVINDKLVFGNVDGKLVTEGTAFDDLGRPYECKWASKRFDMDDPVSFKQFREFFVILHVFENVSSHVRFRFEVDYVDVEDELEITSSISRFGVSKFGDRFITRNILQSSPFNLGRRGRFIKVIFQNSWTPSQDVYTVSELDAVVGQKHNSTLVYSTLEGKYFLYKSGAWVEKADDDIFQPMRIYQISGDYEFRGKR